MSKMASIYLLVFNFFNISQILHILVYRFILGFYTIQLLTIVYFNCFEVFKIILLKYCVIGKNNDNSISFFPTNTHFTVTLHW
jgi:hypothetical protein